MTKKEADLVAIGDTLIYREYPNSLFKVKFTVKNIRYTKPTDMEHTEIIFEDAYGNPYRHKKCQKNGKKNKRK